MSDDDKFGKGFLDELESMASGTEKKTKKTNSAEEIENLLKTTLSEVGIDADRLRASVKAMEAEKKREKQEMDKLDSLLKPIQQPPHETAHKVLHETAAKPLQDTARKLMQDTVNKPLHETVHDPLRQTARGLDRETVHETAHVPAHETQKEKDVFYARAQEKPEIFEKPKPSDRDIFPPLPEKKPAGARPLPPVSRERLETPAKKTEGGLFESYAADKPKKKFPVAAVVLAAVVVIGGASAVLLLSKSGKSNSVQPSSSLVANTDAAKPTEVPDTSLGLNPAETPVDTKRAPGVIPAVKTATPAGQKNANPATNAPAKPAAPTVTTQTGQAAESQGAPAELIQPLVPVQTPRVQEVKPAPQTTAPDNTPASKPGAVAQPAAEAPKKAKLGDLIPLEQVDTQPSVLQRTEAIYPPLGRRFGIEGTVIVNALVSENGDVIRTTILRKIAGGGTYGFEAASEDAIKKWKFKPAVKDGVNVKTWIPMGIVFKK